MGKMIHHSNCRGVLPAILLTVLSGTSMYSSSTQAADVTWNCASGLFDVASCWSTLTTLPGTADNVIMDSAGSSTVRWDAFTLANWNTDQGLALTEVTNSNLFVRNGTYTIRGTGGPHTYRLSNEVRIESGGTLNVGIAGQPMNIEAGSIGTALSVGTPSGDGTLNITNGSTFSVTNVPNGDSRLGNSSGTGTVNVDGAGSVFNATDLYVGYTGNGILNVTNGAVVNSNDLHRVGEFSTGQVVIDGSGSVWNSSNGTDMIIGGSGTGTVTVSNDAQINSTVDIVVGRSGSGNGTLNVDTTDGVVTTGSMTVGDQGTGTVNINDDDGLDLGTGATLTIGNQTGSVGTVNANANLAFIDNIDVIIGNNAGSQGTLNANGVNSVVTQGGEVTVGNFGQGTVVVNSGGSIALNTGTVYVAREVGSTGTVDFGTSRGDWSVTNGDFYIGGDDLAAGGTATVTLNNTNSDDLNVTTGTLKIWNTGTLNVRGQVNVLNFDNSDGGAFNLEDGDLFVSGNYIAAPGTTTIDGTLATDIARIRLSGASTSGLTDVVVGDQNQGILEITGGSTATVNGSLIIANSNGSTGTLELDSGSTLTLTNASDHDLIVGEDGFATMNVSGGATVTVGSSGSTDIGGNNSVVNVDGAGTVFNGEFTNIANFSSGSLNITNGAVYNSDDVWMARGPSNSTATAVVDGAGSQWNDVGGFWGFNVGREAMATLTIQNGGVVNANGDFNIATFSSGNGTVNVDGSLSQLNVGRDLYVGGSDFGDGGVGILNIDDGTVDVEGDVNVFGNGRINLDSFSSALRIGNTSLNTGTLNIIDGGVVEAANDLDFANSSSAQIITETINITGTGSTLRSRLDIDVFGSTSSFSKTINVFTGGLLEVTDADLDISDNGRVDLIGGTVTVADEIEVSGNGVFNFLQGTVNWGGDYTLESGGVLNDTGGSVTGLALASGRNLNVGGTTTINALQTLQIDGGTFSTGTLVNNGLFNFNSGTFNLTGSNLTIGASGLFGPIVSQTFGKNTNVTNTINIDAGSVLSLDGGSFSAGTLNNNGLIQINSALSQLSGGVINNNNLIEGDGTIASTLNNTATGQVEVGFGDKLTFSGSGNTNSGQIRLLGGNTTFTQDLTNTGEISGSGVLSVEDGLNNQGSMSFSSLFSDNFIFGDVNNTGSIRVTGNSVLTFQDDLIHNGTEFRVSAGSLAAILGDYSGSGSISGLGTVLFDGTVNGGNSPGYMDVETDVIFSSTNSLIIEIGGETPGTEYDFWDVTGEVTLGGTLEFSFLDGYVMEEGDVIEFLISAGGISGEFTEIILPKIAGLEFFLNQDVNSLSLGVSAIPVPAAFWLFASGLLFVVRFNRVRVD